MSPNQMGSLLVPCNWIRPKPMSDQSEHSPKPALPPAAERALQEAEARRIATEQDAKTQPPEQGGRPGPDPARYGDWENKGIASDF